MPYNKVAFYYMSGTGNSFRAATWMARVTEKAGAEVSLVTIERACPEQEIGQGSESLLALVMPTHGFIAPWHMVSFACRLPRRKNTHAVCLATRAGWKIGPLFMPGISGSGTFLIALILALKGYSVRGVMSLDMPSNWIAFHWGLHPDNVRAIVGRAEPAAARFMRRIMAGGRVWATVNNLYEALWGIILLLISILYLIIGRFILAKTLFASNRCNGCGICAENCPVGAIKMRGKENKRPYWRYNCESCMRCMAFCPERAIEGGHSWALILYYILSVPAAAWLLAVLVPYCSALDSHWVSDLLSLLYIYPAVFISYYIFYWLTWVPAINALFACTTFTRIYRRYHEPDTEVKDIAAGKRAR